MSKVDYSMFRRRSEKNSEKDLEEYECILGKIQEAMTEDFHDRVIETCMTEEQRARLDWVRRKKGR